MSKERPRQVPAERFAAPWLDFDLHAATAELRAEPSPSRQGHKQRTLFKHGRRTIALFVMDAGASLPEHSTAGTVTILVIDGELTVTMAGEQRDLRAGRLLIISPGVRHDVRATSDAVFVLQVSLESD